MESPTDMVKQAMLSGHREDNRGGLGYIRTCFSYSMRPATYARLRTNILKVNPHFGMPKVVMVSEKEICPECKEVLGTLDPKVKLALGIRDLLKRHDAVEVLEMVTLVACVLK